tara:strand:- start:2101 stop:2643 length:543 start_codon:yes stop_codon:yes gene_type:complete
LSPTGVSQRYTEALASAAEEKGVLDEVQTDVEGLIDLLDSSEYLVTYTTDPFILPEQKREAFSRLFGGKVQDLTLNFLLLLCEKRRERQLAEMLRDYLALMDERRGLTTAEVTSATELSEGQLEGLRVKLSTYSGKDVRVVASVDPSLNAGFIARLGDQVFDGTLDSMVDRLHHALRVGS